MGPMDDARQIRQRFEAVMERMGQAVRLTDQRLETPETLHRGYRTKGPGDGRWEFRFLEAPAGLQGGSLLSLEGDDERWRVDQVHFERDGNALLFVSAQVSSLSPAPEALTEDLSALLQALRILSEQSTLGPLDRDDVAEALDRLEKLAGQGPGPAISPRLKQRLRLLNERFKACAQTAHPAKGRLLKLEAHLKRKGHL
jgi:hypothetical protein